MNSTVTQKRVLVREELDLGKIVSFLKANARQVDFLVDASLRDALLARLEEFAKGYRGGIVVEVVRPDGERLVTCAAAGTAFGVVVGAVLAGLPGAAVGAVVGGLAGAAVTAIRVEIHLEEVGHDFVVAIA